jgi:AcrR family transcriptional regulator
MRADALQNRQRVLEAADAMFREHGIDVGVGEIADAAGVGRGTLFRNFRSKDHLIAAVVSERMLEVADFGRELLRTQNDAELVFLFITDLVSRQQENRALVEGISDEFFAYPEMLDAHDALLEVLNEMLDRGKQAGSIRREITEMDVLTLIKGVCMNPITLNAGPDVVLRHIDLIIAALSTPAFSRPLRGTPATLEDQMPAAARRSAAADQMPAAARRSCAEAPPAAA